MNILVTGKNSFLFQSLLERGIFENDSLIQFEYGIDYTNIDEIIHFGSPSHDKDFEFRDSMAISMIDYTTQITEIAIANQCPIIFASTEGVYELETLKSINYITNQSRYELFKLVSEEYLTSFDVDVLLLRIPRVYDKERSVGLVGKLLDNQVDENEMDNTVTFINKTQFIDWFIDTRKEFYDNLESSRKFVDNLHLLGEYIGDDVTLKLKDVLHYLGLKNPKQPK